MYPSPTTTNEGAAAPSLDSPPALQVLRGASTDEQRDRRLCGGFQRGACAPLCVVAGEGYIREGPHRKGPSLMRPFGYFSGEGTVPRGMGAEPLKLPNRMGSHSREKFPLTCSRYRANRNTPFAPSAPGSAPAPGSSPRGERRSRHTAPGGRAPAGGSPRSASGPPAPGWRR